MITIRGIGVSPGIACGPLHFHQTEAVRVQRDTVTDPEAEWNRFLLAQEKTIEQLGILAEEARKTSGDEAADLLEGHQLLAEDPDLTDAVEALIREQRLSAEAAVIDAGAAMAEEFDALDDPYLKARAADIRDVSGRIASCLSGNKAAKEPDGPVILAAKDLAPSETVQLNKEKVLGLITEEGSENGHTAILARTFGIPAIINATGILDPSLEGKEAFMDGGSGSIYIDPDPETKEVLLKKKEETEKQTQLMQSLKGKPAVSKNGQRIRIYCNIGGPEDVPAVLENDGEGIGLFRSEFLYLGREDYPDEETQFQAYRKVLTAMGDREVIIRTMDIGADKQIDYFNLPKEENPALGMRALRICLDRPEIFRTQLRALYRASVYGNLGIMFPMVASVWEVQEVKTRCEQVKQELIAEGIPVSESIRIGIMVETPAAALMSDRLAQLVDFFSVGTNDLTQYTLACDRQNSSLGRFRDTHHPAVLRLLKLITENAHRYGTEVSICGELAADLDLMEFFLSIGIDELSVSPRSVLPLRQKVLDTDVSSCKTKLLDAIMDEQP